MVIISICNHSNPANPLLLVSLAVTLSRHHVLGLVVGAAGIGAALQVEQFDLAEMNRVAFGL